MAHGPLQTILRATLACTPLELPMTLHLPQEQHPHTVLLGQLVTTPPLQQCCPFAVQSSVLEAAWSTVYLDICSSNSPMSSASEGDF